MVAWGHGQKQECTAKGAGGNFCGSDKNILHPECSSGFIGIYICQNSKLYALSKRSLFYANDTQ